MVENTLQEVEKQGDTISILHTPALQDMNSKRPREEGSYSIETTTDTKFKLMYRKKPKPNLVIEQEEIIDTVEIIDTYIIVRDNAPPTVSEVTHQPSTSSAQIIKKKHSAKVSSSRKPVDKEKYIMEKYKEIKLNNEALKSVTYAQYWKQNPSDQNRLLSAFDYKNRKMKMTFLQPKMQAPKSSTDYRKTTFEVMAKDVHPTNQIEFHKQAGEMIYSTMTNKAMSVQKLQNSLENIKAQLKLEKASSQAKDNRIKSLE